MTKARRVALIAKYFYPNPRMAAKRAVNLYRHLNEYEGLDVEVLTESLNREVPAADDYPLDLTGVRYLNLQRNVLERILARERTPFHKFLARTLFWKRLERGLAASIERRGSLGGYDAFYISLPPFPALLRLALRLKRRWPEKKVILEYRDEWLDGSTAYAELNRLIHRYHRGKSLYRLARHHLENFGGEGLEKRALRAADRIVIVGRDFREGLNRRSGGLDEKRIVWIPNGIADDEIEELARRRRETPAPAPGPLQLVYAGSLFGTQDIRPLLRAVDSLAASGRIRPGDPRISLYGHHEQHAADWPPRLKKLVEFRGAAPRREVFRQYFLNDLILFLVGDWPRAETIVTGKIYELIESGRPLFALLPLDKGGAARELLEKTDAAVITDIRDEEGIGKTLLDFMRKKKEGRPLGRPRRNMDWFHERFRYPRLCRELYERVFAENSDQ